MTELSAGALFAGYVVDGVAGRGGMSVLYRATDPNLHRTVALKVIASDLSSDDAFRQRFTQEAHLAASIDHPNVVPIYGFGEDHDQLYIAMRFVPGRDLRQLITADAPLELRRIHDLLGQIAAAIDSVHVAGLVHRDVKPDNVLVSPPGPPDNREHAYLADFGLTRSHSKARLTQAGQIVGTIAYASPEQLQDHEIDATSDVYSLGCVLFEMITGDIPFDRSTDAAMMYAHLEDPPPSVRARRPDVPDALDGVIATALAKSPSHRYPSASTLYQAFGEACGIGAAGAGPPTASFPAIKPMRGPTPGALPPHDGRRPGDRAPAPATVVIEPGPASGDVRRAPAVLAIICAVVAVLAAGAVLLSSRQAQDAAVPSGVATGSSVVASGGTSATALPADAAGWTTFVGPKGKFSIDFPSEPSLEKPTTVLCEQVAGMSLYTARADEVSYQVAALELPPNCTYPDPRAAVNDIVLNLPDVRSASVTSRAESEVAGGPALTVSFESDQLDGELLGFFAGNTLYFVEVSGPDVSAAQFPRFRDSLRIE